jgi:hypothetical protein
MRFEARDEGGAVTTIVLPASMDLQRHTAI